MINPTDVNSVPGLSEERRALLIRKKPMRRIGGLLIDRGLITEEELAAALRLQAHTHQRLGEILVELGAVSAVDFTRVLAERLGVPFVDLEAIQIDPAVARLLPEELARRHLAIALGEWEGSLYVAMEHPNDVFALDDLRLVTQLPIVSNIAEPDQIRHALDLIYRAEEPGHTTAHSASDDAPVDELVSRLLIRAMNERAAGIHVEPLGDRVRIRIRSDGVLREVSVLPSAVLHQLVGRVKVLAALNVSERATPQHGRFSVTLEGVTMDAAVATVPTPYGESVVIQLLDSRDGPLDFDALGMPAADRARFVYACGAPQGGIVVSGPTGSGRTATLYAALVALNTAQRSIVTVEDPIEYQLPGLKQVTVDSCNGLSVASILRSVLRLDPDVVVVGELRDPQTARVAIEVAATGHLMLSTMHAESAAAVPLRLVDMGLDPCVVASALSCVVSQRLGRRLCENCAEPCGVDRELLRRLGCPDTEIESASPRRAVGCPQCRGTGYSGRLALFETLYIDEEVRRLIGRDASAIDIERRAVANGMETLRVAAMRRVLDGSLSTEEMMRVVY